MERKKKNNTVTIAVLGMIIISAILILSTIYIGRYASKGNEEAVRQVSLLYLDELTGRREQVVENNLKSRIRDLRVAVSLMGEEDLSDGVHLQAYQSRMKKLYNLEKFAFVDDAGRIYTSQGIQKNIAEYSFDYQTLAEPEISIFNLNSEEKKVVIAIPVDIAFQNIHLKVCFMEIDMKEMLSGVSMDSDPDAATFCNIYTQSGIALSNTILDGLEATRRIRALKREDAALIPIIALTANAFDEDVQRSLQAGLNAHLSKPVQPEALFETLRELIGKRERK